MDDSSQNSLNVAVSCLYFVMFPVALLLNGVAAWVSLHLRSTSTLMVYLKNLLAADLLITFTIPVMAASQLPRASVGLQWFACRFSNVILFACIYVTICLMGLVSLDRFFKIVRPCGRLWGQSLIFSRVMAVSVWVWIFGCTVFPTMVLTNKSPGRNTTDGDLVCMSLKSSVGLSLHKGVVIFGDVLFWLVSMVVTGCYICITITVVQSFRNSGSNNSQGKRKTKWRVFLILVVFFVCFVPLHLVRIPFTLQELRPDKTSAQAWLVVAGELTLWLSTMTVCLDPLLHVFLCREFKDKLVDMMQTKGICALKEIVSQ